MWGFEGRHAFPKETEHDWVPTTMYYYNTYISAKVGISRIFTLSLYSHWVSRCVILRVSFFQTSNLVCVSGTEGTTHLSSVFLLFGLWAF